MERNNMEKEFIPYELALKMKQLGFNEPCFGYYYTLNGKDWKFAEKSEYYRLDDEINIGGKFSLLAPLFQQAFRWFREKYDLHHVIHNFTALKGTDEEYLAEVGKADDTFSSCRTYEEAELACLEKLIEIIETK
jgi:hypothetical protein